eukprot:m.278681 g.278681  ORF g.278681 m.278681 type:complete len:71 (-) comp16317_c0_seq3:57-269(-)
MCWVNTCNRLVAQVLGLHFASCLIFLLRVSIIIIKGLRVLGLNGFYLKAFLWIFFKENIIVTKPFQTVHP